MSVPGNEIDLVFFFFSFLDVQQRSSNCWWSILEKTQGWYQLILIPIPKLFACNARIMEYFFCNLLLFSWSWQNTGQYFLFFSYWFGANKHFFFFNELPKVSSKWKSIIIYIIQVYTHSCLKKVPCAKIKKATKTT